MKEKVANIKELEEAMSNIDMKYALENISKDTPNKDLKCSNIKELVGQMRKEKKDKPNMCIEYKFPYTKFEEKDRIEKANKILEHDSRDGNEILLMSEYINMLEYQINHTVEELIEKYNGSEVAKLYNNSIQITNENNITTQGYMISPEDHFKREMKFIELFCEPKHFANVLQGYTFSDIDRDKYVDIFIPFIVECLKSNDIDAQYRALTTMEIMQNEAITLACANMTFESELVQERYNKYYKYCKYYNIISEHVGLSNRIDELDDFLESQGLGKKYFTNELDAAVDEMIGVGKEKDENTKVPTITITKKHVMFDGTKELMRKSESRTIDFNTHFLLVVNCEGYFTYLKFSKDDFIYTYDSNCEEHGDKKYEGWERRIIIDLKTGKKEDILTVAMRFVGKPLSCFIMDDSGLPCDNAHFNDCVTSKEFNEGDE